MRKLHAVSGLAALSVAVLGVAAFTGVATAMPLAQPGSAEARGGAIETVAWQCFQFGNCVWRPNAYFQPYGIYGYAPPPPPRYYRKRYYRY
jgi:hypothetical protein